MLKQGDPAALIPSSPPLNIKTSNSLQLTLHHRQTWSTLTTLAPTPTCGKTATSMILLLPALSPLACSTRGLVSTYVSTTAFLPSSLPIHSASSKTVSYYTTSFLVFSFATASPLSNCLAIRCAHADTENELRYPHRQYIHDLGARAGKLCFTHYFTLFWQRRLNSWMIGTDLNYPSDDVNNSQWINFMGIAWGPSGDTLRLRREKAKWTPPPSALAKLPQVNLAEPWSKNVCYG